MVVCLQINSEPSSTEKLHHFSKQIILIVYKKYFLIVYICIYEFHSSKMYTLCFSISHSNPISHWSGIIDQNLLQWKNKSKPYSYSFLLHFWEFRPRFSPLSHFIRWNKHAHQGSLVSERGRTNSGGSGREDLFGNQQKMHEFNLAEPVPNYHQMNKGEDIELPPLKTLPPCCDAVAWQPVRWFWGISRGLGPSLCSTHTLLCHLPLVCQSKLYPCVTGKDKGQ